MKVKNFSGPLTSAGGVGPSDSLHPPVSVIYVAISFEYRCGFGERLQTLGAPFFDQHGGGPVYFVVYARTKSELLETLGLPGDVRLANYIHGSTRSRADSDYATMVFPGPDSPWRLAKSGAVRSRLSRCLPVLGPPQAISGLIEDSPRQGQFFLAGS